MDIIRFFSLVYRLSEKEIFSLGKNTTLLTQNTHTLSKILQVILNIKENRINRVRAGRIFSAFIALSYVTIFVFVLFIIAVMEIKWPSLAWIMRDYVSMMYYSELLSQEIVRVSCILVITDSRLTKINHRSLNSSIN